LSSFYVNKHNKDGNGHNLECTDCVKRYVKDKKTMEEYFEKNQRRFRNDLWEWCENKAKSTLENDVDFNSLTQPEREKKFMERVINAYFGQQNQTQYYEFISNINNSNVEVEESPEIQEEESVKKKKDKKVYSEEWRGWYSPEDLKYLQEYYDENCETFNVVSRVHKDYLKKIAKASLAMDKAFEDKMNGVAGSDKAFKDNKEILDSLSTSAKFSEKTRNSNDVAGLGSLSEIVMKLEQTGFLQRKIKFEKDDIDKINEDLRWVLTSVGGEL
jgi:hypothetical protein